MFSQAGYRTELTHPHWLGKVYGEDAYVDVIFRSGNAVVEVDDLWFRHAVPGEVFGIPVGLCPPEEILWSKSYVMERERFDGADEAHLLRACAERLDWARLLARFGPHWRLLLAHLTIFGFVYPAERARIPVSVMNELLEKLTRELEQNSSDGQVCQGTFLSRSQYLIDVERWGYEDARLAPRGPMSSEDVARWTASISVDGSF
jgi:hypothetical protein